jgi:hypothetical protein
MEAASHGNPRSFQVADGGPGTVEEGGDEEAKQEK